MAGKQRKRDLDEFDEDVAIESISPYSVANEPSPTVAICSSEYKEALELAQGIFAPFLHTLSESSYSDEVMKALQQKLEAASSIKEPAPVSVGFLGDAGTGKSSLINALLAEHRLAQTGSGGRSCTQVVQRFGPLTQDQNAVFAARISFLEMPAGKELVKQHALNYIQYCTQYETQAAARAAADDEDYDDEPYNMLMFDCDDEQKKAKSDAKNEAETALEVLTALFSDTPDFANKNVAAAFLRTAQSVEDVMFLCKLEDMVERLYQSLARHNGTIIVNANDIDQLHEALEPYTRNQPRLSIFDKPLTDEGAPCNLWPLVITVNVTFENLLTNEGIVLVDLPGITDVNQQRKRTAYKALRECTYYVVTGKINRITSDVNVKQYLEQAAQSRPHSMVLVATSSDDIDIEAGFDCPLSSAQHEEHLTLNKEMEEVLKRLDSRPALDQRTFLRSDLPITYDNPERHKLRYLRDKLQKRATELLIEARNNYVKAECQDSFTRYIEWLDTLTVFCVSSKLHQDHLLGYDEFETPLLSVENTGIPALRTHLRSLPAKIKYRIFSGHCRSKIHSVLNSVEMSCSLNGPERKAAWSSLITQAGKSLEISIDEITEEHLRKSLQKTAKYMDSDEIVWTKAAQKLCERQWFSGVNIPAQSLKMFMKKCGDHKCKKLGAISMTEQLLRAVNATCKSRFTTQRQMLMDWSNDMEQAIRKKFVQLETTFRDDPAGNATALVKFYEHMNNASKLLQKAARKAGANIKHDLNQCFNKATKKGPEGYLDIALYPVYQRCALFAGKGCNKRRKAELSRALYGPDHVFAHITQGFRSDIDDVFAKEVEQLSNNVRSTINALHGTLAEVCHQIVGDSEDGKQLCSDLLALVAPARAILETQIKPLVKRCDDIEAGRA